jgi:hypothetical protein
MNLLHPDTATIVSLVVSVLIPLCSATLTRAHWPVELLGVLTMALAVVNGFFTEWADAGSHFDWQVALSRAVVSFVLAVAAHYGVWKGTATTSKLIAFPTKRTPAVTPPAVAPSAAPAPAAPPAAPAAPAAPPAPPAAPATP